MMKACFVFHFIYCHCNHVYHMYICVTGNQLREALCFSGIPPFSERWNKESIYLSIMRSACAPCHASPVDYSPCRLNDICFAVSLLGKTKNIVNSICGLGYVVRWYSEDCFLVSAEPSAVSLSLLLELRWFGGKMSDVPETAPGAMARGLSTFDTYLLFRVVYDSHDMYATCRHIEGRQECTRESNCLYCLNMSDIEWSLYGHNLQRKEKRKQMELDKVQCAESVSSEDSLAVEPEDSENTAVEESEVEDSGNLKSAVMKVLSKGLLYHGIPTVNLHRHQPRGRGETMIGVARTGTAVVIGVGATPTGKNVLTNVRLLPKAAREVRLVWAPHGAVVPLNPELSVQLELASPGTGLPWAKVQLEPAPHGARLLWTVQLESFPEGTGLPDGDEWFRWTSDTIWFHSYGSWWSWHDRHGLISELDTWYGMHGASRHGAGGRQGNAHRR